MRRCVLVVDDHPANVLIMRTMLESQGYEVVSAADGVEALEHLQSRPIDLVLLDIMMPRMNGLEALQQIRQTPTTAALPVILVTAKAEDADVLGGYRFGADYYLTKPFTAAQLEYGVELILGSRSTP